MLNKYLINEYISVCVHLPISLLLLPGEILIEVTGVATVVILKHTLGECLHFGLNEEEMMAEWKEIASKM
jgi:hypothetical protein